MKSALEKLRQKIPPPAKPRDSIVNWQRVEAVLGIRYPETFKEFIATYGGSVWFGNLSPFYVVGKNDAEIKRYVHTVHTYLATVKSNAYTNKYKKIEPTIFPHAGGLFPFMIDYDSYIYLWDTSNSDPDKWPIVVWMTGTMVVLKNMSIAKMIHDWLSRTPEMRKVWGDVRDMEPERIRLTRV